MQYMSRRQLLQFGAAGLLVPRLLLGIRTPDMNPGDGDPGDGGRPDGEPQPPPQYVNTRPFIFPQQYVGDAKQVAQHHRWSTPNGYDKDWAFDDDGGAWRFGGYGKMLAQDERTFHRIKSPNGSPTELVTLIDGHFTLIREKMSWSAGAPQPDDVYREFSTTAPIRLPGGSWVGEQHPTNTVWDARGKVNYFTCADPVNPTDVYPMRNEFFITRAYNLSDPADRERMRDENQFFEPRRDDFDVVRDAWLDVPRQVGKPHDDLWAMIRYDGWARRDNLPLRTDANSVRDLVEDLWQRNRAVERYMALFVGNDLNGPGVSLDFAGWCAAWDPSATVDTNHPVMLPHRVMRYSTLDHVEIETGNRRVLPAEVCPAGTLDASMAPSVYDAPAMQHRRERDYVGTRKHRKH